MNSIATFPFRRVAVLGAGAVGCYYGGMLARAGHDVVLIGRPAHVDAFTADGLRLEAQTFDARIPVAASTEPAAAAGAELVLFAVKSSDTDASARALAPFLAPDAVIVTLQNGVDNDERVRAALPDGAANPVIAAVVYVASEMAGPGHVRHNGRGELVIGPSPASAALAAAFVAAGVATTVADDVAGALWAKLILNCAYNALSAITRQPYGLLVTRPGIPAVLDDVVAECLAVATAENIRVPGDTMAAVRRIAETMPTQFSSTAQDIARGRPTEIDALNGHIVRCGEALGIPVPANRLLYALVKAIEAPPAA
jgi:2-dehydropantoate 2-reductase